MDHSMPWRVFDHDRHDLPVLVIRATFNEDGYNISLSDLNAIWSESLDLPAICKRATQLRCSIDPGEDQSQYEVLIKTLLDALLQKDTSSIELSRQKDGSLQLQLSKKLPRPLAPLSWTAHLARTEDSMGAELVRPLLQLVSELQQQKTALIAELSAKDHVITRMADRLDSSGMPMSDTFPNVANMPGSRRHGSDREKLAHHVRGLGTFDASAWQKQRDSQLPPTLDDTSIGTVLEYVRANPPAVDQGTTSRWWSRVDIRVETKSGEASEPNKPAYDSSASRMPSADSTSDDENFQHQQDSETERPGSKVDHIEMTQRHKQPEAKIDAPVDNAVTSISGRNTAPSKLGMIGGKKSREDTAKLSEERDKTAAKSKLGVIGGKKDAVSTVDTGISSQESQGSTRRKLGVIGGKRTPAESTGKDDHITSDTIASRQSTPKKSAFTIGGKKDKHGSSDKLESPPTNGPVPTEQSNADVVPVDRPEDEPEDVRADRKRLELKRQLEQKPKPVTKKRRF